MSTGFPLPPLDIGRLMGKLSMLHVAPFQTIVAANDPLFVAPPKTLLLGADTILNPADPDPRLDS